MRLSQVKGRRVMARDNAQVVGTIRRLHLDIETARIVGLELESTVDRDTIVEWPAVVAVGGDALMIENASDRRQPLDDVEQAFVAGDLDLPGKLVMHETGDVLGKLDDLAFDERTGRVTELYVPGQVIPVERMVALGSYALIIPAPSGLIGGAQEVEQST
jgi:sporulation protein YlmC with PRC-barrel domain